jgi:hypothetical protein
VPPIVANTLIVPFVLKYAYEVPLPVPFMMLTVGLAWGFDKLTGALWQRLAKERA